MLRILQFLVDNDLKHDEEEATKKMTDEKMKNRIKKI